MHKWMRYFPPLEMAKKILGLLNLWFWGLVAMFFVVLSIGLAIALIVVCKQRDALQSGTSTSTSTTANTTKSNACGASNTNDNTINLMEPMSPGPFHDLTIQEIKTVSCRFDTNSFPQANESCVWSWYIVVSSVLHAGKLYYQKFTHWRLH